LDTGVTPEILKRLPQLTFCQRYYYKIFGELNSYRQRHSEGLNPISLTDIESYIRLYKISSLDEIENILYFIRVLDTEYLEVSRELSSKKV
jgi:hypothetical protein